MALSTKQIDFLCRPLHKIEALSGVTGSGKSYIIILRLYNDMIEDQKGDVTIISGKNLDNIKENVTVPLMKLDDGIGHFRFIGGNRPELHCLKSGSRAIIVGASDEGAEGRIRGIPKARRWVADEVTLQPKSFVYQALNRCKYEKDGVMVKGEAWWSMNPDHPEHFIKKEFMENSEIDIYNTYWSFEDNPLASEEFVEQQRNLFKGVFYERMILGKWVAAEGSIFDNFDPAFHVVDDIPPIKEHYLSFDWGYNNPLAALLVGEDSDGVYYVLDEFYQRGRLVDEHFDKEIRGMGWDKVGEKQRPPSYCYFDVESPSDAERMRRMGWNMIPALKHPGSVSESIKAMQMMFNKQGNGRARLYISRKCKHTINEVSSYRWKTTRGVEKDEPEKTNDHAVDCLKGIIYTREAGRVRVIKGNPFK